MSEDSTSKFYSGGVCEFRNYDVLTWKIPSVSSIPHQVDYVVQSPPFTFDSSSFILKMYPYGQTERGSEGYIDLILERLHSECNTQNIFIEMFCTDVFDKKVETIKEKYENYIFSSPVCTQFRMLNYMQNLKDCPEKWRIAPKDTFTLVCALGKKYNYSEAHKEDNFSTISIEQNGGKRFRRSRNYGNPEIGEIVKEYSHFKHIFFKICKIASVPDGYEILEKITFANAVWILKIYPNIRMKNSNKRSFDMVLERFQTEIPDHHIFLEISISDPLTNEETVEKIFFFNTYQTQGEAITFQLKGVGRELKCLHFVINMRNKKNTGLELDFHFKSTEQVIADGSSAVLRNNKVLQDYKKLFLQHEDSDITIKVKEQEFPAHKLILKSRSPVLASAFRNDMKEKSTGILNIEDCEPPIFSEFLHFLYCGEVEKLSKDNVFKLFTVADKYDVPDLRTVCLEFMKQNLSVDTFCNTIALALQHSEADLVRLSTYFFARNLQEIILTAEWQSFITENPIQGNELMIKALVTDNSHRTRDPDRQTQRDGPGQTRGNKDLQKLTQQNRDPQRRDQKLRFAKNERDPQTRRDIDHQKQTARNREGSSTEENYENKYCSIV